MQRARLPHLSVAALASVAALLSSLSLGCGSDPPPRLARAPELRVDPMVTLGQDAVREEDWGRKVFYAWLSPEQLDEARATHHLLRPKGSAGEKPLVLDVAMAREIDPLSALLRSPMLSQRRSAWVSGWATVLAAAGTRLVRIELRDDAVIAQVRSGPTGLVGGYRFRTASGSPMAGADVAAHAEKLAAVYHVSDRGGALVREFVLVNESQIAKWSYATEQTKARLEDELAEIRAMRGRARSGLGADDERRWREALADGSPRYAPTVEHLEEILAALAKPQEGAAIEESPSAAAAPPKAP